MAYTKHTIWDFRITLGLGHSERGDAGIRKYTQCVHGYTIHRTAPGRAPASSSSSKAHSSTTHSFVHSPNFVVITSITASPSPYSKKSEEKDPYIPYYQSPPYDAHCTLNSYDFVPAQFEIKLKLKLISIPYAILLAYLV